MSRADERRKARQSASGMTGFHWVLAAVAVAGVSFLGYAIFFGWRGEGASAPVELPDFDDQETLVSMARKVETGDPEAPFTIIEFADYQCPGCAQFALGTKPRIDSALVAHGRAKFAFFDFPLTRMHPNAFLGGARRALRRGPGRFLEVSRHPLPQSGQMGAGARSGRHVRGLREGFRD